MMFEGEDLVQKSDEEMQHIRGKRIAMILQDPMVSLNPLFTIGDQVAEPIRVHEGASRASAWSRARELLRAVRIPSPETRLTQYPHEMSGGMRQRIVGAIGISCEPRLLIADEPTTSLDLTIQAQYLNLLRDLQQAHGLALIFITHNLGIVAKMCDKLAVMYAGRVVEYGPVSRIFNAPAHPYTRALLNSIPRMSDSDQRLSRSTGSRPTSRRCRRAARSPRAARRRCARCRDAAPPPFAPEEGRIARCWLAEPVAVGADFARRERGWRDAPSSKRSALAKHFRAPGAASLAAIAAPCARSTGSRSRSSAGRRSGSSAKSGCGKTTTAKLVLGLEVPTGGTMRFEGARSAGHSIPPAGGTTANRSRRCSRIRTPRSIRACGSATSSPSRCVTNEKLRPAEVRDRVIGAARSGRAAGALGRSVPARILRRAAPAHRDRPRARAVARD